MKNEIQTIIGVKRVVRVDEVPFQISRDLPTNDWCIRIPDSAIREMLGAPYSKITNVQITWQYDDWSEAIRAGEEE